jgi:hypothetical protein
MKNLKHLCFIGIVVLLASAMVSCDFVEKPDVPDNIVGYTDDGRALVSLTIGTPGRALTPLRAKGGVDFYEVIFVDGSDVYRASWNYTQVGRIIIPEGEYETVDKAMLFAGRRSDKTLLAIGTIDTPTGGLVDSSVTQIVFALTPLETDINVATPSTSSFQITEPEDTHATAVLTTLPKAKVGNAVYPVFEVPKGVNDIEATFEVKGIVGGVVDYTDGIALPTTPAARVMSTGVIVDSGDSLGLPLITAGAITADLDTGIFTIAGITTPDEIGFAQISIEIPVSAILLTDDVNGVAPITWFIRGGLRNDILDLGATANSLGGAILLGVGGITGYTIIGNLP